MDVEIAHEMASVATRIALDYFDAGAKVETKGDGSPVTEADLAVEAALGLRPKLDIYGTPG